MVSEEKLDKLEETLRQKVQTLTGFGDDVAMERKLEQMFKFFDTNGSGTIEFEEFLAAMTRHNFVGVQRELEALFERYDDDCSGFIDYKEFAKHIFGVAKATHESTSKGVIERVKARIIEMGGANGIRSITHLLRRMDKNGSDTLDRQELAEGLASFGVMDLNDTPGGDIDKLMSYFDRDGNGTIAIEEFHRGIRGQMNRKRKLLVKAAFSRLDRAGNGQVSVDDIREVYSAAKHPDVLSGRLSEEEVLGDMIRNYEKGPHADGIVTWTEFLDYYKDLSSCIEGDDMFELMMRNAWHLSGGEGWAANSSCRRVLVTHSDGSQQVCEIQDDLGVGGKDTKMMMQRLQKQGVTDIVKISLTH